MATATDIHRAQVIRLITKSFASELVRYGMPRNELVSVSTELLDYAIQGESRTPIDEPKLNVGDIIDTWITGGRLQLGNVRLRRPSSEDVPRVASWLQRSTIRRAFFTSFPVAPEDLETLLVHDHLSLFCAIEAEGHLVGLIGGAREHESAARIEMRKLVGDAAWRGRGVGTRATMLWLYLVFQIHELNKVFLHSLDTNIRNINLNSRFGFELEGILRNEHAVDGGFVDVLRMGLTRDRWLALQPTT